jgi:hypothetical protein
LAPAQPSNSIKEDKTPAPRADSRRAASTQTTEDPLVLGIPGTPSTKSVLGGVADAATDTYHYASEHAGSASALVSGAACLALTAPACVGVIVGGGVINAARLHVAGGNQETSAQILNLVGTGIAAVPAAALAAKGVHALIPDDFRLGINYFTGMPSLLYGLLDPTIGACGSLVSALGDPK